MAGRLRAAAPASTRIVLLSHGMESTDLLHLIRARKRLPLSGRVRPFADVALGRVLRQEAATRAEVDGVLCLSAVDVVHERWVGAGRVDWLPRIVVPAPLPWKPEGRRLGWVGTLDHAPNLTGLVDVLEALARREDETVRIRVVGGPKRLGAWLAGRFRNVDYLGPLDRAALESEAQSWSAFLHPIFCWPRGCSTKLASALAWGLPIVTTPQGRRGYVWRQGSLIEAESPEAFLDAVERLFEPEIGRAAARDVALAAGSSPTLVEVAERLGGFLSDVAGTAP